MTLPSEAPRLTSRRSVQAIPTKQFWLRSIRTVLDGTGPRRRSIKVVSATWLPLFRLIKAWEHTNLASLESISMERANTTFGMQNVCFDPEMLIEQMPLFGQQASFPRLRNFSMSAVHIDWKDISVGFQNLRKMEIKNQTFNVGPSFEEFVAMLSSSPQLESLDVAGFCPEFHPDPAPGAPMILVAHPPALKEFTLGWKNVDLACTFPEIFQIGRSLERPTLLDTESGLGYWRDPQTRVRTWFQRSERIFEFLNELGIAAPADESDLPLGPFIYTRGVKRLEITWAGASWEALVPFLNTLTELDWECQGDGR